MWCDGGTGTNLRLRVDRVAQRGGLELTQQIALVVPWAKDPGRPGETSLDFAGQEFRPHESPERLREAIAFLAGGFAAGAPRLAAAVPELRREIEEAALSNEWRAAVDRAADAWRDRHVRGDLDARSVPARPVFVGSGLVTVEAEGERYTFRFTKASTRDATGEHRPSKHLSDRGLTRKDFSNCCVHPSKAEWVCLATKRTRRRSAGDKPGTKVSTRLPPDRGPRPTARRTPLRSS